MKVLDLFCGLGGWSAAFKNRGHEVITLDNNPKFKPDICKSILDVPSIDELGKFDFVLASPPCQSFSVAAFPQHYWKMIDGVPYPNSPQAELGLKLASHTFWLLENTFSGKFYVIENPRGLMRKVFTMPKCTVAYCQYGSPYMKPTDLWGNLPPSFVPKMCKPKRRHAAWWKTKEENKEVTCTHAAPPRGSITGIQGPKINEYGIFAYRTSEGSAIRSLVAPGLSLEMCLAAERDIL